MLCKDIIRSLTSLILKIKKMKTQNQIHSNADVSFIWMSQRKGPVFRYPCSCLTGTSPLECIVVVCGRHDEFLKARSCCIMHHQYYIVVVGKKLNYHLFTSASDISPYWDEAK